MNIYEKLIKVRESTSYLEKDKEGMQFKYVGSSDVLIALRKTMDEQKLLLIPSVLGHNVTIHEKTNKKGEPTQVYFTELVLNYKWVDAENPTDFIEVPFYSQGVDTAGEKGVGKALTYAEKYFLLKFFNIATDKDDPDTVQNRQQQKDREREDKENFEIIQGYVKELATIKSITEELTIQTVCKKLGLTTVSQLTPDFYQQTLAILKKQIYEASDEQNNQLKEQEHQKQQMQTTQQLQQNNDWEWGAN
ncbi:ERF family protein [Listeria booriae]|uniref:ERF family protein n=1 Tax=Listeria booriae TaxID=1552123 RepID=UPI0016299A28|nr:ERF family protein [Listeria booriae]MBC2163462.1 hypothetical protein [Listeria booriae]